MFILLLLTNIFLVDIINTKVTPTNELNILDMSILSLNILVNIIYVVVSISHPIPENPINFNTFIKKSQ